jgi:preprotein translocase SecF subunit
MGTIAPGAELRRVEVVGPRVSAELFQTGSMAVIFALLAIMLYIWFRFEWQFGIGAVVTLVLDITKTVGLYAVTGMEFNLTAIAAVLTILGYSVNDKVVVYDRMRENLRKFKHMPLEQLTDLSMNETLNRSLGTSMTLLLSALPLAFFGGDALSGFAWVMLFGIFISASSSVFIAAPIVLYSGRTRLRRDVAAPVAPAAPRAT